MPDLNNPLITDNQDEILELTRCLEVARKGYGSLKILCSNNNNLRSYMLKSLKEKALDTNFIVCDLSINKDFKLSSLPEFYNAMMLNLMTEIDGTQSPTSFEDIFLIWLEKIRSYPDKSVAQGEILSVISKLEVYSTVFSKAFLAYIKSKISDNKKTSDALAAWLMGGSDFPDCLISLDIQPEQQRGIDFISAFSKFVTLIGFSGILVKVNDLHLVLDERSDIRNKSYENLRLLLGSTKNDTLSGGMFLFTSTREIVEDQLRGFYSSYGLCQSLGDLNPNTKEDLKQTVMFVE